MELTRGGIDTRPEATLLATRAAEFLESGPADPVSLIGYVCNLPGAPRIVAEHMAEAIFAGRPEFRRDDQGRWILSDPEPEYIVAENVTITPAARSAKRDVLAELSYVVVDLETTGTSHRFGDRITEVAAVVVRDGKIVDVFEKLVNPQRQIPTFVTRLTNITWEMVKYAPLFEEIEPRLLDVLKGHVFAAHNAKFDWQFLCSEVIRSSGRRLAGRQVCTVRLAKVLLPQLSRRSLDYVARYYGVEIKNRHRAGGDAIATAKCLIHLLSDATDKGCITWGDLESIVGRRRRVSGAKRRRSAMPRSADNDSSA